MLRNNAGTIRTLAALAFVVVPACGGGGSGAGSAFLHAQGQQIVDAHGTPVFLKGVSLGNEVWANAALPTDHDESDFQRLADMGGESTRVFLYYPTLEGRAGPGTEQGPGG